MSQAENSTTPIEAQEFGISELVFSPTPDGHFLLRTEKGSSAVDAIDLAADLADGIQQISTRLADASNEGETVYVAELRCVAMLAEVASALTRAAERGMRQGEVAR